MTTFYFCKTCNTPIAGSYTKHTNNGHSVVELKTADDLRLNGIVRDPNVPTSSINKAEPLNINGVRKYLTFIGKSGREIQTRRDGSSIVVRYEYVDDSSGAAMSVSEQEYYKLLFSEALPSPSVLHTLNNRQFGSRSLLQTLLITRQRFAIVTNDPDDADNLLFVQDSDYGIDGRELVAPYDNFRTSVRYRPLKTNASESQRARLFKMSGYEDIIYYDVLAPREREDGIRCLTRVLITAVIKKEHAINGYEESRQFVLYELSRKELSELNSGTSLGWATSIVQDARSILCS